MIERFGKVPRGGVWLGMTNRLDCALCIDPDVALWFCG